MDIELSLLQRPMCEYLADNHDVGYACHVYAMASPDIPAGPPADATIPGLIVAANSKSRDLPFASTALVARLVVELQTLWSAITATVLSKLQTTQVLTAKGDHAIQPVHYFLGDTQLLKLIYFGKTLRPASPLLRAWRP